MRDHTQCNHWRRKCELAQIFCQENQTDIHILCQQVLEHEPSKLEGMNSTGAYVGGIKPQEWPTADMPGKKRKCDAAK